MTRSNGRAPSRGAIRCAVATLLALTFAPLAPDAPLWAQGRRAVESGGVVQCQKCHANREFLVGKAKTEKAEQALFVPDTILRGSRHAKLNCADCHQGYGGGYPHNTGAVAVPCQKCHEKAGEEWTRSIHAPNAKTKGDAPSCVSCHGQHEVLGSDDPRSPTYALNVAKTCAKCHGDRRIVGTYFDKPRDAQARTAVAEYFQTVHGIAGTKAGLVVTATCNDCHGAHLILPPDSTASTINRSHIAGTCGACHAGVLATFDSSSHGKALAAGKKTGGHSAPVCIDCHIGHKIVAASDSVWFRGVVSECGTCHERLTKTYFETYHGQVTELGFGLTAKCSDCHTPHAMLPATDARSSVNPAHLVETCRKCHADANEKFVQYLPHGDPQDRASYPALFWAWAFMTFLLVSIFSFFGIHTVLWTTRVMLDRRRGGGAAQHPTDDRAEPSGEGDGGASARATQKSDTTRDPVGSGKGTEP